jgi:Ca2+-binding RTX toxin-like protein
MRSEPRHHQHHPARAGRFLALAAAIATAASLAVACQPPAVTCEGRTATVVGTNGDDTLTGTAAADVIAGLAGDDTIRGLGGDDIICGDAEVAGDDDVDGGTGSDTVGFDKSQTGNRLDLAAGTSFIQGADELESIENAVGGPATDYLRGDSGVNHLYPGKGDIVEGRGGNDVLEATCTNCDVELSFQSAPGPVTVDAATRTTSGAAGADVITFPVVDVVLGPYGDTMTCAASGPGCAVDGNGGGDRITGTTHDDTFIGDTGDDRLVGLGGFDTAHFDIGYTPVSVNLQTGTATGQGADTLVGISRVVGSYGDDVLIGSGATACELFGNTGDDRLTAGPNGCKLEGWSGDDVLTGSNRSDLILPDGYGTPGNDTVLAGDDADVIRGDLGDDVIDGGGGVDTLDHSYGPGAELRADLGTGVFTGYGTDDVSGIEHLIGGGFADTIRGSEGPDFIESGSGADTVIAQGGDDTVFLGDGNDWAHGGTGNDIVSGDKGDDTLYGGPDVDLVSFRYSWPGVVADMTTRKASGPAGNDTFSEFEDLAGDAGDDRLTGDAGPNVIEGASGIDTCVGGGGADQLRNCP